MPATWDLPRQSNLWDQQDINRYNRLPVWCAEQQSKQIPYWSRWDKLFSTINWEANMGDVLQGIIAEMPPVTKQYHAPRNITEAPLKTVASHFERANTARIKRHLFESPLIHFLPSFRDFRRKQIPFGVKALNKIVGTGVDFFHRWQVLQQSRYVYVVGATGDPLMATTYGEGTDTTTPKDASWLANMASKVGNNTGFLDFRQMCAIRQRARHDLGIPPWEGSSSIPKENETFKGKFLLIGDPEIYEALSFDEHILNFKDYARDLINSEFKGVISGNIAFYEERYPLRFTDAGVLPEPEIEAKDDASLPTGNSSAHETIPNPDYVNAEYAIAFFVGYMPYETIKIGPPPSEFASGSISMGKFHKLNWNGEVRITDDVLVNYGSGNLDTNKYGEYLQLICDTVLGIIPNTPRYCFPIIYRRIKAPSLLPIA